ncbi:hypothetical protein L209DRAFT_258128 [Thermothelomyces heterothallicus CBS 203.75]
MPSHSRVPASGALNRLYVRVRCRPTSSIPRTRTSTKPDLIRSVHGIVHVHVRCVLLNRVGKFISVQCRAKDPESRTISACCGVWYAAILLFLPKPRVRRQDAYKEPSNGNAVDIVSAGRRNYDTSPSCPSSSLLCAATLDARL